MLTNHNYSTITIWKNRLGLLPIPLFQNTRNQKKFILLNGNIGNFCLDLEGNLSAETARNYAWSSDVGHYLSLKKDIIEIHRWDQIHSSERFVKKGVEEKLEKFHEYLQNNQPNRDISIISFMMSIFRKLRNIIGEKESGQVSLKAFLFLIACGTDNIVDRKRLNLIDWGFNEDISAIGNSIRDGDWNSLIESMMEFNYYSLKPEFPLMLYHTSGKLFQEAHYKCLLDSQLMFEGILPDEVRPLKYNKIVGVYYTPPALARTLVEEVILALNQKPQKLRIFDPACGSGEFLKEILQYLILVEYEGDIELIGWDISPIAVDITKFVLTYMKRKIKKKINFEILCENALRKVWPQGIDIIIMNPPFQSWQDMGAEQREEVKTILEEVAEKRIDLSSAFIWKAVQSLRKGGVLGTILPVSILSGESYNKFRNKLSNLITPNLIGKLGNQFIFSNAIVDTAIYVGKVGIQSEIIPIALWADYKQASNYSALRALRKIRYSKSKEFNIIDQENYSIYSSSSFGKENNNWIPRSYKSYKLFKLLENFPRVKDFFDVHQGARTGLKSAFILEKFVYEELPVSEKKYFRLAILNESVEKGRLKDLFYVFYPYSLEVPQISSENDLKMLVPTYYFDILNNYKDKLRNRCRKDYSNWWKLSEPGSWQKIKKTKLVSAYFGKAGSFALDKEGEYIVVQGYGWLLKSNSNINIPKDEIWYSYLSIMCSTFINSLLPSISNHVGGGQWDLSTRFIQNMPIPDLFSKNLDENILQELSEIGASISQGKNYDTNCLEQLILHLYGIE